MGVTAPVRVGDAIGLAADNVSMSWMIRPRNSAPASFVNRTHGRFAWVWRSPGCSAFLLLTAYCTPVTKREIKMHPDRVV